jgi:hypothetical protein
VRTTLLAALCLLLAAGHATGQVLYAVRVTDAPSILALSERGVTVRHLGTSGVVVEGADGLGAALTGAGYEATRLGRVADWEEVYLCYPRSRATSYEGMGNVLWVDPRGSTVVGAARAAEDALRFDSFMVVRLPGRIDVASWFDDTPPAHIRRRTRADELGVRELVEDVIESVSEAELVAHVDSLALYPDQSPRTRFATRQECLDEAREYVVDALSARLPPGSLIGTQTFSRDYFACNDSTGYPLETYAMENVFGVLEGSDDLRGCYVVCAHYDAIAHRSFPDSALWFCDNPAPGADDNGTGVATVLEAARVLSGHTFPFDIRFVLFSGEELGLLGSEVYADSTAAGSDTIYGVINVDMIGFKRAPGDRDTCHIVSNGGSWWLGEWIVETAEGDYQEHFEGIDVELVHNSEPMSDHYWFWRKGYDAVMAVEHSEPRDRNPYYHTVDDLPGTIYPSQFVGAARLVAASLARMADPLGTINLAIAEVDVDLGSGAFVTGTARTITADVHVFGPLEPVAMTLEVWDGAPGDGRVLSSLSLDREMGGGEVIRHEFEWRPGEGDVGEHTLTFLVSTEDTDELTLDDNSVSFDIRVDHPDLFIMDHFVYPNPVPSMEDLKFGFELSRQAGAAKITVYDLLGQELHEFEVLSTARADEGAGTSPGWNAMRWSEASPAAPDLPSGVYIYRLRVRGSGTAGSDEETGKFAVVR